MYLNHLDVLLVEDNPSDADFIQETLNEATRVGSYTDFVVETQWAKTLHESANMLKLKNFDVILLDLSLPDSHGLETIKQVMELNIKTPVIVLTGDRRGTLWADAIQSGAQDYLIKGNIDEGILIRTIEHAIERSKWATQLQEKITELEIYSEKLKRSNIELEQFAYIASHDLQEPLRSMLAFSERLTDMCSEKLDDTGKNYLERLSGAGNRMQRLLDDILDYSRVVFKRTDIKELSLNLILTQLILDFEHLIKESKATIILLNKNSKEQAFLSEVGALKINDSARIHSLPNIATDETQIRRMFQNLLSNAIKYRSKTRDPLITIAFSELDHEFEFQITDNGIGFEEEYKDKIFMQFQRLHGMTEYEGTGMGLATVKKIIELHDGSIKVSSIPGEGSSFSVKLPLKNNAVPVIK
jgi:signal transduction histidine kinase